VDGLDERGLKLCCLKDRWDFETSSGGLAETELE